MAMIVKMPNGDVEHFESATRWKVSDGDLTLFPPGEAEKYAVVGTEVAVFAPGGWWMARKLPEQGPCAVCRRRPTNGRNRCLTGGQYGRHVYIEDFDADEAA